MLRHFDEELSVLNQEIIRMGSMVEEAIYKSVESLKQQDKQLAQAVIDADATVDELELKIDEMCLDLIARRQPVAADLRFIDTAMKISTDLERMADLSVDIAERTLEIADQPLLKPLIDIPKLAVIAQNMTRGSIDAFVKRDVELAKKTLQMENEADKLRNAVQEELVNNYIIKDGSTAPRAIPLLLVARHLERICDHATNICEDVVYMIKGEVVKHHLWKLDT
jgi:phosphate transport system protein